MTARRCRSCAQRKRWWSDEVETGPGGAVDGVFHWDVKDSGAWLCGKEREMPASEVVVLPRDALLEFFGAVALPPWTDEHGHQIGGGIDCAPIAQRVSEWIDGHDLTGVELGLT